MTTDEQTMLLRALSEALNAVSGDTSGRLVTELCAGEPGRPWLYVVNLDAAMGTGVYADNDRYQTITGQDIGLTSDLPAVVDALLADIGYPARLKAPPSPGEDDDPLKTPPDLLTVVTDMRTVQIAS